MSGVPVFKLRHLQPEVVRYADEVRIEVALYYGGQLIGVIAFKPTEAEEFLAKLKDNINLAQEAESWKEGKSDA